MDQACVAISTIILPFFPLMLCFVASWFLGIQNEQILDKEILALRDFDKEL
jgi:hypothetical protein